MRVVKKGRLRLATCPFCESVLQYNVTTEVLEKKLNKFSPLTMDARRYHYIVCPVCDQEIDVTDEVYDALQIN